ncbi:MAG: hypothetical protein IV090_03400 [Candidatus Sericytochromatia bacterium]|nr:hypothetical protein [Candidatus Sericytochromatia bacterium]
MRKRLKHLLPLLLCLHLQGCVWTVYNWREIPDPDTIEKYQSKAEKLEHYQKYAIQDLKFKDSWRMAYQMGFSTVAEPQTYYDLNSYAPVIYQLAPEAEAYFAEAQNMQFYRELSIFSSSGITLFLTFPLVILAWGTEFALKQDPSLQRTEAGSNFAIAGLITSSVALALLGLDYYLLFQQEAQYAKIKETYNAALRKQLELEETDLGALPPPSLALSWESPQ